MAWVLIQSGSLQGKRFEFEGREITFGRANDNIVPLDDASASGHHCTIQRSGNKYTLQDLGSTNGTRLNGAPVGRSRLKPKDVVRVGAVDILFDGNDVEVESGGQDTIRVAAPTERISDAAAAGGPSAFGRKRNTAAVWFLVVGVLIGATLVALGYWFLSSLFSN